MHFKIKALVISFLFMATFASFKQAAAFSITTGPVSFAVSSLNWTSIGHELAAATSSVACPSNRYLKFQGTLSGRLTIAGVNYLNTGDMINFAICDSALPNLEECTTLLNAFKARKDTLGTLMPSAATNPSRVFKFNSAATDAMTASFTPGIVNNVANYVIIHRITSTARPAIKPSCSLY